MMSANDTEVDTRLVEWAHLLDAGVDESALAARRETSGSDPGTESGRDRDRELDRGEDAR
jgi:hypothetical protein